MLLEDCFFSRGKEVELLDEVNCESVKAESVRSFLGGASQQVVNKCILSLWLSFSHQTIYGQIR